METATILKTKHPAKNEHKFNEGTSLMQSRNQQSYSVMGQRTQAQRQTDGYGRKIWMRTFNRWFIGYSVCH